PESYDTIVTTNLFGDIITDLGAMLQGGLGVAAGANIHPGRVSMFEPIHGSAPKYKGQNKANPIATILSVALMLEHLGEREAAERIEQVVRGLITSGQIPSLKAGALPCDRIGTMVADGVRAGAGALT
ncbi:MAG: 3-isopropylmalate dehydrogenase, partial [Planctomycetota bacterium]